jgi:predicted nucleotidyltransferase
VPELDISGILAELNRDGVEFLVIGGVAVGFHGYVRATKDIDIVPAPDPRNLAKLARLLRRLDAQIEGAEEFEEGELPIDGLCIKIVSYEDLVRLKEMAARPEDLTDLRRLRQARGEE